MTLSTPLLETEERRFLFRTRCYGRSEHVILENAAIRHLTRGGTAQVIELEGAKMVIEKRCMLSAKGLSYGAHIP